MNPDNLYAASDATTGRHELAPPPQLANRLRRLAATSIDAVPATVIFIACFRPTSSGSPLAAQIPGISSEGVLLIAMGLLLCQAAVNIFLFYRNGQTIGKKLLQIKVVRVDGSRCDLPRWLFLRCLPNALLPKIPHVGLGIQLLGGLLILGPQNRCLHDYLAGTKVVKA